MNKKKIKKGKKGGEINKKIIETEKCREKESK